MSIVEKALRKAHEQSRNPASDNQSTAIQQLERRPSDLLIDEVASSRATQVVPGDPAHRIEFDLDALRSQQLLAPKESEARIRDEYRRIKWPLLEAANQKGNAGGKRNNLIMVTSSLPAEGKTFTSINLSLAIATERDSTVLLVDTDIAKPNVTRALGLTGRSGLVDLLLDESLNLRDVVVGTDLPGLNVLPAGKHHALGPELLASRRMEQIVNELGEARFGRIALFDTSPLLATNEAQVLSRLVGQVLMVVRADETTQSNVMEALALISKSASVAMLLNQSRSSAATKYYGESYGHGKD